MAGTKFQYDESGTTFYYFILTFLAMIIIPFTFFCWPKNDGGDVQSSNKKKQKCYCDPCILKENYMKLKEPSKKIKKRLLKIVIVLSWIGFAIFAYKVANIQADYVTFDPFEILGIDAGASGAEIKKAYRRLSLVFHPDKETGDEKKFMRITKAYAALTDDAARKNWEEYGNPDGPGAMSFGIALPSWIVEKENSVVVLMVYVLLLMIVLPICVRIWWSNSSKYGGFKVLLDTSQLYYYFINKTQYMEFRKVLMVIAGSFEFDKRFNNEIIVRPSDNDEIPQIMKGIPNLSLNNREQPLCFLYSLKARTLIYAHLLRLTLPQNTLERDKKYILTKVSYLIQEFVQCAAQLTLLWLARRIPRCPLLETLENAMKLNACLVQGLWHTASPLLQLPHISEFDLRHFMNQKRSIRNIQLLASMEESDRRNFFRFLNDQQYLDVLAVLSQMPLLEIEVRTEVMDDEDVSTITAGALVTVTVKLTRRTMSVLLNKSGFCFDTFSASSVTNDQQAETLSSGAFDAEEVNNKLKGEQAQQNATKSGAKSSRPWEKAKKGNKKAAKNAKAKKKAAANNQKNRNNARQQQQNQSQANSQKDGPDGNSVAGTGGESDDESRHHSGSENELDSNVDEAKSTKAASDEENDDDNDDDDWTYLKQDVPKKEIFQTMSKVSHSVHCPYFPEDKQEHWWVYISDRKERIIKTLPYLMTNLVEQEEVELKFTAPYKPGLYQYMVNVRCDSYVDLDYFKLLKLDVKEAPVLISVKGWDISFENLQMDLDEDSAASDSDLINDDDDSSDDDDDEQEE